MRMSPTSIKLEQENHDKNLKIRRGNPSESCCCERRFSSNGGISCGHVWLVVGMPTPLKNDGLKVSWDDDIPKCFWKFIIRSCSSHDQIRESEKAKFHISGGH